MLGGGGVNSRPKLEKIFRPAAALCFLSPLKNSKFILKHPAVVPFEQFSTFSEENLSFFSQEQLILLRI